jgi:para-aminobenzoate synthetase component 1
LFSVESYRNVHQLVSTVTGTLKPDTTPFEAFLSAFPGGSITGAPKRRAMEIIDELEPHGRGPYCGSLFWWDADNRLESNIAIRSLQTFTDGTIRAWAGCGIVADSDPEDEYQESMSKIQSLLDTLEGLGCPDGETGST